MLFSRNSGLSTQKPPGGHAGFARRHISITQFWVFVSSCLAVSWIPPGGVLGLLIFCFAFGNFIMCWGSIWYFCLIWWLIILIRCLCEWLEFRLRLRDLGVQVSVWRVLNYQKFDINDAFIWLVCDYGVV